jgi:hypothetical protein
MSVPAEPDPPMDKLFDAILKNIPAEFVPALIALVAAFFGVYYFKGFRNYTDAISDKLFLTLAIVICAGFLVSYLNKSERLTLASDVKPLLMVPDFEDDERRQFKSVFIQQLQAFVGKLNKDAVIVPVSAYIRDRESARLTGNSYGATAVLYQPKVIRLEDKKTVLCFSLLILDPVATKAYPPVPAEMEKATLEDISTTLLGSLSIADLHGNPLAARVETLERKVNDLAAAFSKVATNPADNPSYRPYRSRKAVLVGVNYAREGKIPPLRYAASDAQDMTRVLELFGFETTVILNEDASVPRIREQISRMIKSAAADDLLLFYYAGNSMRSVDVRRGDTPDLILNTFDFRLDQGTPALSLAQLVSDFQSANQAFRLIVVDGCHGTFGLSTPTRTASPDFVAGRSFQIITGTQDTEFGFEMPDLGGGLFTRVLASALADAVARDHRISTTELLQLVSSKMAQASQQVQKPKLLTLNGKDDIVFAKP